VKSVYSETLVGKQGYYSVR